MKNQRLKVEMQSGTLRGAIICLFLFAAAGVNAEGILHGIPGGKISGSAGLSDNPIAGTDFPGQGRWITHHSKNASVLLKGEESDRRIELFSNWFVRNCSVWYRDEGTTPVDSVWEISTVLTWTGGNGTTNSLRLIRSAQANEKPVFEVAFCGADVSWKAGAQSGHFTSKTGLDLTKRTLRISYNPVNGKASAMLSDETIFSTTTDTELVVKTVLVRHFEFSHNPGTLSVYNILSSVSAQ